MTVSAEGFVRSVKLLADRIQDREAYPFTIPAVRALGHLALDPKVTYFVGENGTGKSTVLEAIAVAAGLNPEGGSESFRFETRPSHSSLHEALRLVRGVRRPQTSYFLRAESLFNVATEIERLDSGDRPLLPAYGGRSLHERSHGEAFLALVVHRFGPNGLYLLDEPEAGLSVHGCLALLQRIDELVSAGSQFIIATHSPIVMSYPAASIYAFGERGLERTAWQQTASYTLTRSFLASPEGFFQHLFATDGTET